MNTKMLLIKQWKKGQEARKDNTTLLLSQPMYMEEYFSEIEIKFDQLVMPIYNELKYRFVRKYCMP